jgi:hypothetical protein
MREKQLLEVLQEVLHERVSEATNSKKERSDFDRVKELVVGKVAKRFRTIRRHIKASRILGGFADIDSIRRVEQELRYKEEKHDREVLIRENYYRHIAIGFLDMTEAILWRYEIFDDIALTVDVKDTLHNLFYSGKRTLLMYSKWLALYEEGAFIKQWIEAFEPIEITTYHSIEEWLDFFDKLPAGP